MKRFSIIKKIGLISLAALLSFGVSSCSNLAASDDAAVVNQDATKYGRVAFTLDSESYTISDITLKYKASGDSASTTAETWETSDALKEAAVSVPVGTYTFTLSATLTKDGASNYYAGSAEGTVT